MAINVGEALNAYRSTLKGLESGDATPAKATGGGFGDILGNMLNDGIDSLKAADKVSLAAVQGKASINEIVTATSSAEMALQTVVSIRDKLVTAYQELMRSGI